jgi:hypothetical protein
VSERTAPLGAADVLAVFLAAALAEEEREGKRYVPPKLRAEHEASQREQFDGLDVGLAASAEHLGARAIQSYGQCLRTRVRHNRQRREKGGK